MVRRATDRGTPPTSVAAGAVTPAAAAVTAARPLWIVAKRWRCYLGFHRWQRIHNAEGGGFYNKCRDRAKFSDIPPTTPII